MFDVNTAGGRFISGRGPNPKPGAEIYYFNFSSGESRWQHPQDDNVKNVSHFVVDVDTDAKT